MRYILVMKVVQLKNNHRLTLRPVTLADSSARHRFFVELSLEQTGIVHTPDEIDFHTQESEEHIGDFLRNKRGLWLVAVDSQGEIVGEVDILVKNLERVRHVGVLTVGVLKHHQRLGLASALLTEALNWSRQNGLLRIELSVFAKNAAALALYNKHGFVVEGIRKNFLRRGPSEYEDDVLMAKYL